MGDKLYIKKRKKVLSGINKLNVFKIINFIFNI